METEFDLGKEDKLSDHGYEGIRELDNRLPPWWLNLFYITIICAFGYMLYYHVSGTGDLSGAEYYEEIDPNWKQAVDTTYRPFLLAKPYHSPYYKSQPDVTPLMMAQMGIRPMGEQPAVVEEAVTRQYDALKDAVSLGNGKNLFLKNCTTCHGQFGEGGFGPNLTDDYWLHGDGRFNSIVKTVRNGVPIKGMIAWKMFLKPEQILEVSSYIASLRGTSPQNAKAPQGVKVE